MSNVSSTSHSQSANAKSTRIVKVVRCVFACVGIVACLILILFLICNHVLIAKSYTNKDEIPSIFSVSATYVMTDSMAPYINGGDLVFIRKVAAEDVATDDVIAFFDPESAEPMVVVHRVKEILLDTEGNISFLTKGDANNTVDMVAVPADNLVGKYVFRLRGLGSVAMFMQTTSGLIVSVSVPIILLICGEVVHILWGKSHDE